MALNGTDLTAAVEAAFESEWARVKDVPLPSAGVEDRRMLFAAVAHGLLNYLEDHQDELLVAITLRREETYTGYDVTSVNLGIEKGG